MSLEENPITQLATPEQPAVDDNLDPAERPAHFAGDEAVPLRDPATAELERERAERVRTLTGPRRPRWRPPRLPVRPSRPAAALLLGLAAIVLAVVMVSGGGHGPSTSAGPVSTGARRPPTPTTAPRQTSAPLPAARRRPAPAAARGAGRRHARHPDRRHAGGHQRVRQGRDRRHAHRPATARRTHHDDRAKAAPSTATVTEQPPPSEPEEVETTVAEPAPEPAPVPTPEAPAPEPEPSGAEPAPEKSTSRTQAESEFDFER